MLRKRLTAFGNKTSSGIYIRLEISKIQSDESTRRYESKSALRDMSSVETRKCTHGVKNSSIGIFRMTVRERQ